MPKRKVGTQEEWSAARKELLEREQELGNLDEELAKQRKELPWVPVEKEYTFDTEEGKKTLPELLEGRSQLLIYHLMFGPTYEAACPGCTGLADHLDAALPHLNNRDVTLICISRSTTASCITRTRAPRPTASCSLPTTTSCSIRYPTDVTPTSRSAAMTSTKGSRAAAALTATLGVAAASWVVAVQQLSGMDMGAATDLGSFAFFIAVWVAMMAAMMLPGAVPAAARFARAKGRALAAPLFAGSYLAVWTVVGLAVYALYRPHGSSAAGALTIAASSVPGLVLPM